MYPNGHPQRLEANNILAGIQSVRLRSAYHIGVEVIHGRSVAFPEE